MSYAEQPNDHKHMNTIVYLLINLNKASTEFTFCITKSKCSRLFNISFKFTSLQAPGRSASQAYTTFKGYIKVYLGV